PLRPVAGTGQVPDPSDAAQAAGGKARHPEDRCRPPGRSPGVLDRHLCRSAHADQVDPGPAEPLQVRRRYPVQVPGAHGAPGGTFQHAGSAARAPRPATRLKECPMRPYRSFVLLLALLAPLAQAQTAPAAESTGPVPYHIEVVMFRQGEPIASGQPAPENWAEGAELRVGGAPAATRLDAEVAKLTPENGYEVLMHR